MTVIPLPTRTQPDSGPDPDTFDPSRVTWVLSDGALSSLDAAIAAATEVVLDLETTGLDEWAVRGGPTNGGVAARIVLASLTLPAAGDTTQTDTWVVPLSHPDSPFVGRWRAVLTHLAETILRLNKPLTNQHVKFDAKWVQALTGVNLSRNIFWCTQVGSHLLDETTSTSLKDRAPATFGVRRWDDFDLTYPGAAEDVPLFDLGLYAARDTYWTWRLARLQRSVMFLDDEEAEPYTGEEVTDARLGRLSLWCAMPMVATLTAVEQRGFTLDLDWVEREMAERLEAIQNLGEGLARRYEGHPNNPNPAEASWAPTSNWFRAWSELAVEQGDLTVAEETPTGNPRWSKSVLVRQERRGSSVAADLLALRGHIKRAEYLASWAQHAAPDGRIHTTYWAGRVVTGRLSSEGPNMQQVTAVLKPAFVPRRPGLLIAELDYSQIELRVAAMISGCEPMLDGVPSGRGPAPAAGAQRITGKDPADVTPQERQAGKSANFGLLYGMSPNGFREYAETVYGVSFTEEESLAVHQTYFDTWVGLREWHVAAITRAHQRGEVVSPIGRVRRLPGINDDGPLQGYAERAAINAPVQGYASDLMQMAAASIEGTLPGSEQVRGARIVATVHDSIVVEVPADGYEAVVAECAGRMIHGLEVPLARMGAGLTVPLTVSVKIGTRWGLSDVAVIEG